MNKPSFLIVALLTGVSLFTGACRNDDDDNPTPVQPISAVTTKDLAADPVTINPANGQPMGGTNKYTFFSFKDGKQVANSDSATNKWDIGFRGTSLIVNGGAGRAGQGGAYIYSGTFEELTAVPETATFATDQSATQLAIPSGSGNGWYNYNPSNNIISPIPGKVFVIRTGDGKYAKMEILSYYKGAPAQPTATSESRFYTFRYSYQPDGSKNLK